MAGSLPNASNKIAVNALEFNLSSATSSGGGSGSIDGSIASSGSLSYDDVFYRNESFVITPATVTTFMEASPIVVPEGQVWKITHANRIRFTGNAMSDGSSAVFFNYMSSGGVSNATQNNIILREGTHTVHFQSTYNEDVNNVIIQAIKYNIN